MKLHMLALCAAMLAAACSSTMGTYPRGALPDGSLRTADYSLPETRLRFAVVVDDGHSPAFPSARGLEHLAPEPGAPSENQDRSASDSGDRYHIWDASSFFLASQAHQYTLTYSPALASSDVVRFSRPAVSF